MTTDPKGPSESSQPQTSSRFSIIGKLLAVIGIENTGFSSLSFRIRSRFLGVVAIAVLVGICSAGGLVMYSTSPTFCRSCHIMEPYYQAWVGSKHKNVTCVDCHYPPGDSQTLAWKKFQALSQVAKYVTRTYSSKPFAEVEDMACLRSGCHSTRIIEGKVVTERGVNFDHKPHLEGVRKGEKLRCVSCHSQVVQGKHIEVTYDTCYLCHLKDQQQGRNMNVLGGCTGCHKLPDKDFKVGNTVYNHKKLLGDHQVECQNCHQEVIQGNGDVSKEKCFTCHNQLEKIQRFGEVAFLHEHHVTEHSIACFHCHDPIKHAAAPPGKKTLSYNCTICHVDLHETQKNLYRGLGAKGVKQMPSSMYLANVDCVACHLNSRETYRNGSATAMTYEGTETGCVKCHGPQYKGLLVEVQNLVNTSVEKMELKIASISVGLATSTTATQTAAFSDAKFNVTFLKNSKPIHNIYYVSQVVRKTDEVLTTLAKDNRIAIEDTSSLPLISGSFCGTLCHEKIGVKVPAVRLQYKQWSMPHKDHVDQTGLACADCHEFGEHKTVSLKQPTNCKQCHEGRE